jgi:uncharacterized Ntn-hydrolase superfamily protein
MTWSIVARGQSAGQFGIAVATCAFAVGARVPHIASAIGAVATQAMANQFYGTKGLALLRDGVAAPDVIPRLIADDPGRDHRQVHVMDAAGRIGAHTGASCVDWCGHVSGDTFSVAGNMLTGPQVIHDTAAAYARQKNLPFARRLIAALRAGEAAGGDKRGKQSAALVIYGEEDWSDLDLRVDDHADPLAELARLEAVSCERYVHFRKFLPSRRNPAGVTDRAVIEAEIAKAIAEEGR